MRKPATKIIPDPLKRTALVAAQSRFPAWLPAVLLGLATLAIYWPVTSHDFVNYDDDIYVVENLHVQAGLSWDSVKWALLNPVNCNWHPVTVLSYMLDCQIFGLNPWGYHLTNVLLHAFNVALVFVWLQWLTGATWRSAAVAALFGWHPVHVESVAWVAERKDVLSAGFGLLALIAYGRYARSQIGNRKPEITSYWLAFLFLALGLMSKPMLVTWPFVMLLLDYWPLGRFSDFTISRCRRLLVEKIPFFALAAAMSIVTLVVQKQGGAMTNTESLSIGIRSGNALVSYCRYLGKMFWPTDLTVLYPHPGHWPEGKVLLAGGLLVGLTALFWRLRRHTFLLMGWLWYVGTLVPVIGLVQVGNQSLADRYTYIPSLGVLLLVVWGAYELARNRRYLLVALSVMSLAAVILCLAITRQQLGYWRNSETLFRHTLAVTENNSLAHDNLGSYLIHKDRLDEAMSHVQEALRLTPDYANAHRNLGLIFDKKGQLDAAISQYREALRCDPNDALAHNNLGYTLYEKGQLAEAISQCQESLRLKPDAALTRMNLGNALFRNGQLEEAVSQYQEVLRLTPDDADAHRNIGLIFDQKNNPDAAINEFREALRLKPDFTAARTDLDQALLKKARADAADRKIPKPSELPQELK